MQSIWRQSALCRPRLPRRHGAFLIDSSVRPRWSYPVSAHHGTTLLTPTTPALPDNLLNHDPLFPSAYEHWNLQNGIGVGSEKKQVKLDRTIKIMDETWRKKDPQDFHGINPKVGDDICPKRIIEGTTHRDGSIFKKSWKSWYPIDFADREETVCVLSKLPRDFDCFPDEENCICHRPAQMVQIFSLRLAKTPINSASIQLYGYMATRDDMDGKMNYIFNHSRDDPIIVHQGSLIQMTGPKRGMPMFCDLLFEFDMRIKTGEREDDIQLIDGVTLEDERMPCFPVTVRISGNSGGAVDICFSLLEVAVEATIEVIISEVQSPFHLSVSSIVYVAEVCKEVQLFDGPAGEIGIKQIVTVPYDSTMHLKFKICGKGSDSDNVHYCSFNAKVHGCTNRQIKLGMACISMKVAWSPPWF